MAATGTTDRRAPTTRAMAPDLARGLLLAGIAIANGTAWLYGRDLGPSFRPTDGSVADRVVDAIAALFIDNRSYPMFAFLVGYGVVQWIEARRRAGVPWPAARRVLVRRQLGLVLLGGAHAVLLFTGDILSTYGLLGLGLLWWLGSSDRAVLWWAVAFTLPLLLIGGFDGTSLEGDLMPEVAVAGWSESVGMRAGDWAVNLLLTPVFAGGIAVPMLLGVVAARHRILDDPAAHRRVLRRLAVGGLTIGVLGGIPLALASTGTVQWDTGIDVAAAMVHVVTGVAGGVGIVAACGLVVARRQGNPSYGPWCPLVATVSLSLSCYLAQSVLFAVTMPQWGLGWGAWMGTAQVWLVALGIWALTVIAATVFRTLAPGRPGPAEWLLRRFAGQPRGVQPTGVQPTGVQPTDVQPTERQGSVRNPAT